MSIRIQNDGLSGAGASGIDRLPEASTSTAGTGKLGTGGASQGPDRVEISSLADGVSGSAAASSARQASRVKQLAELYNSGRYEADPVKVSQALVADALGRGSEPKAGE